MSQKAKPNSKEDKKHIKSQNNDDKHALDSTKTGTFIFKDKSRYEGEYKEIEGVIFRNGAGRFQNLEMIYQGSWEMDKMHGKGKLEFCSGAVFEGGFKENQFQGPGSYTWSNASSITGEWLDNSLNGPSRFVLDNHGYIGNLKKGEKAVLAPELY